MTKEEEAFFAFIDTVAPEEIYTLLDYFKYLEEMAENAREEENK
jgi:hypothetical protein